MFAFANGQPMSMLDYLEGYLDDPYWCHATDVVPMVAYAPPARWPHWSAPEIECECVVDHAVTSLKNWSAFRRSNLAVVAQPYTAFRQHLTSFILDVQSLPGACMCLSDVAEDKIRGFASTLTHRLYRFGLVVKGVGSCVLPSKTAHFYLLGLVPAYDRKVIQQSVLPRIAWGCSGMESYVRMCWWVLQQFRREGTLKKARAAVANYMLDQQMAWTLELPQPEPDHWLLQSMDSVIAEYTLIQMSREADDWPVLRRKKRQPFPCNDLV